jgi:aspartyl-tRNA(Asn)/glutamyl-tRNA(Gln) amidotransferase subunit A
MLADARPRWQMTPAVARLRAAGGVVVGRTNMSEFAFSGVGINPHFGTPANPCDATPRIPGGSSSGAAVSVANGSRLHRPGFRHRRLDPHPGRAVRHRRLQEHGGADAHDRRLPLVHHAGHRRRHDAQRARRGAGPRDPGRRTVARTTSRWPATGWPWPPRRCSMAWTPPSARAFERTLKRLRAAGARIDEIPLAQIQDLGTIQATGGFAAAESYACTASCCRPRASSTTRACACASSAAPP